MSAIEGLHREVRRLRVALVGVTILMLGLQFRPAVARPHAHEGEVLRVRGLVVVDESGMARVVLGAPVPWAPLEASCRADADHLRHLHPSSYWDWV